MSPNCACPRTSRRSSPRPFARIGQAPQQRTESERDRPELSLGRGFDADAKDGETFGKLSRYETAIERSLFRSLHELRQIQEKRHNSPATNRTVNGGQDELALFDTAEAVMVMD
jgi:hypothetical protein